MWWTNYKEKGTREAAIADDHPGTSDLTGWLDARVKSEEGRFREQAREPFSFYSPENETVYVNPASQRLVKRDMTPSMRLNDDSGLYLNPQQARDWRAVVQMNRNLSAPGRASQGWEQIQQSIQEAQEDGNHGLSLLMPCFERIPSLTPEENENLFHHETGKAAAHERIHREQDQLRSPAQRHLDALTSRDIKLLQALPESQALRCFLAGNGYDTDAQTLAQEGASWLGSGDEDAVFGRFLPGDKEHANVSARTWLTAYAQVILAKYGADALRRLFRFSSPLTKEVILAALASTPSTSSK